MFTVDFNCFDVETREMIGSLCFFHETTIDETLHTETAQQQQQTFVDGLNSGYLDEMLIENAQPQIYDICPVEYSPSGLAVGVKAPVISNIVLRTADKQHETAVRAAVLHRAPAAQINVYYRNV